MGHARRPTRSKSPASERRLAAFPGHLFAFPKSHDILVPPTLGLTIDRRIAAELTESSLAGRYPGTEDPDAKVTGELVAEARRVLDWVRAYLSRPTTESAEH